MEQSKKAKNTQQIHRTPERSEAEKKTNLNVEDIDVRKKHRAAKPRKSEEK